MQKSLNGFDHFLENSFSLKFENYSKRKNENEKNDEV